MQLTFDPNSVADCNTVVSIMDHLGTMTQPASQPSAPAAGAPPAVVATQPAQPAPPQSAPPAPPAPPGPPTAAPPAPPGPPVVGDDPLPNPGNLRTQADLAPIGGTISFDSFKDRVSSVLTAVGGPAVQTKVLEFGFGKLSEVPAEKYLEVLAAVETLVPVQ